MTSVPGSMSAAITLTAALTWAAIATVSTGAFTMRAYDARQASTTRS